MNMKKLIQAIAACALLMACSEENGKIDRYKVVERNNPRVTAFDPLASLSVGNGNFAFTVDATGLQTFPEYYSAGVPLGTQSQWGWHRFPDTENYVLEETLEEYDFGKGKMESYPVQFNEKGRRQEAANYLRANAHRLHLGIVGFELTDTDGEPASKEDISQIEQTHDMWRGIISSSFQAYGLSVITQTLCHPEKDMIAVNIVSPLLSDERLKIKLRFPYPTGGHSDDACDWNSPDKHTTQIIEQTDQSILIERTLDNTTYYVRVTWEGKASVSEKEEHYLLLNPEEDGLLFTVLFTDKKEDRATDDYGTSIAKSSARWEAYWENGGFVDFGACKDTRAKELERRVILSQYLMAIQCAGTVPPQETGLTYNSWFGKFHLEMHWWHAVHFALWNRTERMEKSLDWYTRVVPVAKAAAERQGYSGIRWMKMVDLSGAESPSSVGPFLIWQQPHLIYMAELIYRREPTGAVINRYKDLVFKTAEFMSSFCCYDKPNGRYVLKGLIPAQETLRPAETVNPPFELSYWHYGLNIAQQWRERAGLKRVEQWDEVINGLSSLASKDGLYLAAESAPQTYQDRRFTSDHPAVLGAYGILPRNRLFETDGMKNTLHWVWDNWNWDHTWGWDYPMTAMCAARLGETEKAVNALLMDKKTNTYLPNGHNYQDDRLRVYLPGNGGLLTAVAMMCAGWDGCKTATPGFPKDGNWNVKWEDLLPMP